MSIYLKAGLFAGFIVGLVVVAIFLRFTKTDGDSKCKYDERQSNIRGKAYKLSFFTLMIYNVLYGFVDMTVEKPLLDTISAMVIGICLSITVNIVYCIWKDAYFSLNENPRKVLIGFGFIGIFNLVIGCINIINGTFVTNGMVNFRSCNLTCGIMFIVLFATLLAKKVRYGKGEQEAA
ncbi:hypothetical protein [Anaerocolumna chitinilytica]|nr:hypothetical protein [Anaerocolumna chitinilytica]